MVAEHARRTLRGIAAHEHEEIGGTAGAPRSAGVDEGDDEVIPPVEPGQRAAGRPADVVAPAHGEPTSVVHDRVHRQLPGPAKDGQPKRRGANVAFLAGQEGVGQPINLLAQQCQRFIGLVVGPLDERVQLAQVYELRLGVKRTGDLAVHVCGLAPGEPWTTRPGVYSRVKPGVHPALPLVPGAPRPAHGRQRTPPRRVAGHGPARGPRRHHRPQGHGGERREDLGARYSTFFLYSLSLSSRSCQNDAPADAPRPVRM